MLHLLFLFSVLAFVLGPLLLFMYREQIRWRIILDGFTLVTVGGIALLHLIPEALVHGGIKVVPFVIAGILIPPLMEKGASFASNRIAIPILLIGLLPHIAVESASLQSTPPDHLLSLGVALIVHRLPVGLILFSVTKKAYNIKIGWFVIALLIAASVFGFGLGDSFVIDHSSYSMAWLQGLVGGSLLHVLFSKHILEDAEVQGSCAHHSHAHTHHHEHAHHHDHHKEHTCDHHDEHDDAHRDHHHDHHHKSSVDERPVPIRIERHVHQMNSQTLWAALGAFLGAIVIAFTFLASVEHGHGEGSRTFVETFLELAVESAPALFVAYLLAGIVSATLTAKHSQWLKRGGSVRQSLQGVLFGLPLPICSCGVLPLYETLVKRGVPATAAMGFLIATPELGIDAILLSIPLLGGEMTIARLVSAFLVALIVAVVLGRSVQRTSPERLPEIKQEEGSLVERLKMGLHFGMFELFDHTMPWILMGLAVAAWLDPILGSGLLAGVPSYIQVPMFALIGIPLYVCASGATPIAAIAIYNGISPGAALAFLLAGPATNITTFGVLTGLHSKKTAISFGVLVTFLAILTGWSIDWLTIQTQGEIYEHSYDSHSIFAFLALILLGLMFVGSVLRQGPRGMLEQVIHPMEHQH